MKKYRIYLFLMAFFAALCNRAVAGEVYYVSLINLIATPEKYDGKIIFVQAYVKIAQENMSICQTSRMTSSKDCLWLEIDNGPYDSKEDMQRVKSKEMLWKACDGKRVSIHGLFDANNQGNEGLWSGAIKDVSSVYGMGCSINFTTPRSQE